jgi:hypothetical protein
MSKQVIRKLTMDEIQVSHSRRSRTAIRGGSRLSVRTNSTDTEGGEIEDFFRQLWWFPSPNRVSHCSPPLSSVLDHERFVGIQEVQGGRLISHSEW